MAQSLTVEPIIDVDAQVDGTIVSPVFKEEPGTIQRLIEGLHTAAVGNEPAETQCYELILVDDTVYDGTSPDIRPVVKEVSDTLCFGYCPHLSVRHVLREGEERTTGLSGAVLLGTRLAASNNVCIMDSDMQHPPSLVPELFEKLSKGFNLVATSRYIEGGSTKGLDGTFRKFVSRSATWLAKGMFPRKLAGITDPMTGFYAFDRTTIKFDQLKPDGFKILLEKLLHARLTTTEVPLVFKERDEGVSKGNLENGVAFLKQLVRHRLQSRLANFLVIGGSVGVLGSILLSGLTRLGVPELTAYGIQFVATVALNFWGNYKAWRRESTSTYRLRRQIAAFGITRSISFAGGLWACEFLLNLGWHHQLAYFALLLPLSAYNYLTAIWFVFGRKSSSV